MLAFPIHCHSQKGPKLRSVRRQTGGRGDSGDGSETENELGTGEKDWWMRLKVVGGVLRKWAL